MTKDSEEYPELGGRVVVAQCRVCERVTSATFMEAPELVWADIARGYRLTAVSEAEFATLIRGCTCSEEDT